MARWVLGCPFCDKEFTHTEIAEPRRLEDYYFQAKPKFPDGGLRIDCPNCKKASVFQSHQLIYRAD